MNYRVILACLGGVVLASAQAGDFESPGVRGAVDRQLAPYGLPGWHALPSARLPEYPSRDEAKRLEMMNWKLDTIVIPTVDFREIALQDAMIWLQAALKQCDHSEDEPSQKGFLLWKRFGKQDREVSKFKVTLQARNATAREVLTGLAQTLGLGVEVGPYVVRLVTPVP